MGTKYSPAVSLKMMLDKMQAYSNNGPGQQAILADMTRLANSVSDVATIAESADADSTPEQRQARTLRAASKLSDVLPTVQARLETLKTETVAGFDRAFTEHSGLTTGTTAAEIRAHLKALRDPGERSVFVQELVKNNDDAGLGAVIFAQPFLSGLDATTHSRLKSQIEEARLPELKQNREVFNELAGNLEVAIHEAGKAARELGNPGKLAGIEERATKAREAEERLSKGTMPGGL